MDVRVRKAHGNEAGTELSKSHWLRSYVDSDNPYLPWVLVIIFKFEYRDRRGTGQGTGKGKEKEIGTADQTVPQSLY